MEDKELKGKTNTFNKIQTQEYPTDYYTGDVYNAPGCEDFASAVKNLDQSELAKLNKKLQTELEKGLNPKFAIKK